MKTIVTLFVMIAVTFSGLAQGIVNFGNSSSTLISINATPIPGSSVSTFYFAVFMAPSGTVTQDFQSSASIAFYDPAWGPALFTTVNHATAAGRLATTAAAAVIPGFAGGSMADFIIRGWSASSGATYAEALTSYNNGLGGMLFATSRIANNIVLGDGGAIGTPTLFGVGGSQVGGFAFFIPEPSSMALAGLGAGLAFALRRRNAPDHK